MKTPAKNAHVRTPRTTIVPPKGPAPTLVKLEHRDLDWVEVVILWVESLSLWRTRLGRRLALWLGIGQRFGVNFFGSKECTGFLYERAAENFARDNVKRLSSYTDARKDVKDDFVTWNYKPDIDMRINPSRVDSWKAQ